MPFDRASQTLSRQGLKVDERRRLKGVLTYLSTKVDGADVTVYCDQKERVDHISVRTESITKEAVATAKERLTKRFGAVKETSLRAERMWGTRTKLFVTHIAGEEWYAREEYRCYEASGPLGAFDLTCGQPAPEVEQRLRAAGFEAHTTAKVPDPCEMPNAPSFCEPDARVVVQFRKGEDEGSAEVDRKSGLVEVTFRPKVRSYAEGLARAKPIEALRGPATEIEDSTITTWRDATAEVSLDVREQKPQGTLFAFETYSPPRPDPGL